MRDPQQRLPLSLPHDTYPASTDVKVASWQDGMRTLTYTLEGGEVVLKHVFTSNVPSVQTLMTDLLERLQVDVRLRRLCREKSLYFSYDAGIPGKGNASAVAWDDAPHCITGARDLLVNHAQWYCEKEKKDAPVNHLSILAWVVAGSQRGRELISAKNYPVLIMCLGCEVVISLTRKSFRRAKMPSLDDLIPLEDGDATGPLELNMDVDSLSVLTSPTVHKVEDVDMEATSSITGKAPTRKAQKGEPILVTLVHGDMLMVSGDNFEYSLQRSGTSILLVGTRKEQP
ncbi:hypothetical protein BDQ12DRAFT_161551 [Crucibulum laeve]|uniref:Uncharacterized protein n=1 Tax=Crucibulum laeve TaxID=68775 RepID=A0A5C3LXR6_9AGAR|nr:hypothetical protein BDQ12DRAFT_161551 [Crucibulum laeve]